MGASQSKVTKKSDIVNSVMSNVMMESSQQCTAESSAKNVMSFSDIKTKGCAVKFSNISQEMLIETNFTCSQDAGTSNDLTSQFNTKLNEELNAKLSGLGGALVTNAEVDSITNLKNQVTNNINVKQLASCMSKNMADQKLEFGKYELDCTGLAPPENIVSFDNISQRLVSTQTAKCLSAQKNVAEAAAKIDAFFDTKATAENKGLDIIGMINNLVNKVFGTWQAAIGVVGAIVVCCFCLCSLSSFLLMRKGGPSSKNITNIMAAMPAMQQRMGY
jgi:hypothetical protein